MKMAIVQIRLPEALKKKVLAKLKRENDTGLDNKSLSAKVREMMKLYIAEDK